MALEAVGTFKKVDLDKGVVYVFAGGQDRTLTIGKDLKVLGTDGKDLPDGLKAKDLKEGADVTITVDLVEGKPILRVLRLGKRTAPEPGTGGKTSFGLKPLTEMTAEDKYKGEDGGLYGGGKNEPPQRTLAAAKRETAKIVPLDAEGQAGHRRQDRPGVDQHVQRHDGVFAFKKIADADPQKSPLLTIVDCAQGGQAMAQWVDPKGQPWAEADQRCRRPASVPNRCRSPGSSWPTCGPSGELAEHGKKLQKDTTGRPAQRQGTLPEPAHRLPRPAGFTAAMPPGR